MGPGGRPLPEGIEVCRQPSARGRGPWSRPAPSQPSPDAGSCAAVRAVWPVQSTGPDCRGGGRSVSDRRPEDPTAAAVPRPVRPGRSAGPQATFPPSCPLGKKVFRLFSDVAYAVSMLCRAMARPTPALFDSALRVVCYLFRHRHVGLFYECGPSALSGMSDADWAVRHSTSGYVFTMSKAAISWGSKKQQSIALSSCEAEIVAASEAAKEAIYLDRIQAELGFKGTTEPITNQYSLLSTTKPR